MLTSFNDNDKVELLVSWQGFEEPDNTWESLERLYEDVPVLVTKFGAENAGKNSSFDDAMAALE